MRHQNAIHIHVQMPFVTRSECARLMGTSESNINKKLKEKFLIKYKTNEESKSSSVFINMVALGVKAAEHMLEWEKNEAKKESIEGKKRKVSKISQSESELLCSLTKSGAITVNIASTDNRE